MRKKSEFCQISNCEPQLSPNSPQKASNQPIYMDNFDYFRLLNKHSLPQGLISPFYRESQDIGEGKAGKSDLRLCVEL